MVRQASEQFLPGSKHDRQRQLPLLAGRARSLEFSFSLSAVAILAKVEAFRIIFPHPPEFFCSRAETNFESIRIKCFPKGF
jgi:hypothetical protein